MSEFSLTLVLRKEDKQNSNMTWQRYKKVSAEANENEVFRFDYAEPHPIFCKYTKNLRNNGRIRVKFDKWLVHIPFLCYLTILLISAEGAVYGGY